jgi:hypothetical protein
MSDAQVTQLVPVEHIERMVHLARGEKVLLDADLAVLYGVTTGALNRAVKRNPGRFPPDFMFQLTEAEASILKCQIGISSLRHGGRRRSLPYAFTAVQFRSVSTADSPDTKSGSHSLTLAATSRKPLARGYEERKLQPR